MGQMNETTIPKKKYRPTAQEMIALIGKFITMGVKVVYLEVQIQARKNPRDLKILVTGKIA